MQQALPQFYVAYYNVLKFISNHNIINSVNSL